ncbi:MAG TPA: aminomethyl-transferring glycine dehydrogenase [Anaerolineales bacterium]|nr:aminomethyl-transferring glycine dehydrogenase [Anaerolineales bacterium]
MNPIDGFAHRHLGPRPGDLPAMLETVGIRSLDELVDRAIPGVIRMDGRLDLPRPLSESEARADLADLAARNQVYRSYIGLGYYGTITPAVIQRNILENPGWYTQYTPYQAEIAQGRLEALLNFQTVVTDLTGMDIANASMLDEATAAAEAMTMAQRLMPRGSQANVFFISENCFPQTIAVVKSRAEPLGIEVVVGDHSAYAFDRPTFGVLVQYPDTGGDICRFDDFFLKAREAGAICIVAADLLALTLLRPPSDFGGDIAVGSTQRFGVPLGYGGPHAAYMACRDEHKRQLPGRLVGVSVDKLGRPAMRLTLQTREQHIRRERATSNICTAQVLLAIMASMYAVYHGPEGLTRIARRVRLLAGILRAALASAGYQVNTAPVFDTLRVREGPLSREEIERRALERRINLFYAQDGSTLVSIDETVDPPDLADLLAVFGLNGDAADPENWLEAAETDFSADLARSTDFLAHPVFNTYRSETEMLRYITKLQRRDLSLAHSMIPLGSCTMKLNATTEMLPVTWAAFGALHPFAPRTQAAGYTEMFDRLNSYLEEITGFSATSLQPNAGSQGEYTGLLVIRAYHLSRGDTNRDVCLIPASAHGTNPASASMAGLKVVVVETDEEGNIEMEDLRAKAEQHSGRLSALMVTYPSTHGVYETGMREICRIIHENGGQVYMDGANMNALVGYARPGDFGADVCHLNLHKTFCIPHGGGGPGMGPICVAAHLAPFLPDHPLVDSVGGETPLGVVSAAPWGSAGILPISYAYIRMMGEEGLRMATAYAILNANYIAERLEPHFPVLYRGESGRVAHECIIEMRHLKEAAGAEDVAKRLMDYGFHAPTLSFPVPGTLMIEPTESESREELDRFCEAMISIREEMRAIEEGRIDPVDNPLHNAPHTAEMALADDWSHPYSRTEAAFPAHWIRENKFWPFVARIDNVYGDRNLFCVCVPVEMYAEN